MAHRAAPAAPAWSCRRRAGPPARRRCGPRACAPVRRVPHRSEEACRSCGAKSHQIVMPGHSSLPGADYVNLSALPGIHVFPERENKTWMAVTSTAMTEIVMLRNTKSASRPRPSRRADTLGGEAERRHVFGAIDIAQIDDHRLRHLAFDP